MDDIRTNMDLITDEQNQRTIGIDNPWTLVSRRKYKEYYNEEDNEERITEPCWFYNNGGCRHKDGTEKPASECKYLHIYSENVKRPPHLNAKKPCDKYNLEGDCRWYDNCKYSHKNLTPEEWERFYPDIPYTLKNNVQKRIQIENKINDLESRIKILEFKQDGISKDVQQIGKTLQNCIRQLNKIKNTCIYGNSLLIESQKLSVDENLLENDHREHQIDKSYNSKNLLENNSPQKLIENCSLRKFNSNPIMDGDIYCL